MMASDTDEPPTTSSSFEPNADELLARNAAYADAFDDHDLAVAPRRQLAIVACMDSRMDIFGILGLEHGDAHVIRNAGGVITDDVIRSLCVSQRALGTREILLLHHTNCGLQNVSDDAFKARLERETGMKPWWSLESFVDPYTDVAPIDEATGAVAVHRPQGTHPRVRVRGRDRPAARSRVVATDEAETSLSKRPRCSTFPRAVVARWQSAATERTRSATAWAARHAGAEPASPMPAS